MLRNDIFWRNSEQDCDHEVLLSSITAGMTCIDSTKSLMNKRIARGTIMAFPTESGRTSHTARFLCLVDLTVNGDYGVDVVVRRTDERKLRFKA